MSNEEKIAFKTLLKQACLESSQNRILNAQQAMQQAQDSANNQEKSSAGDKYETSRAMGQSDRDMNARQLQEAQKDFNFLNAVPVSTLQDAATVGALIQLEEQLFFIAIGLGAIHLENKTIMVISHKSPLFEQLKNKKKGDKILFQNKEQKITSVF